MVIHFTFTLQSTGYDHISGHSADFFKQKFFGISPNCYKPINRNPSKVVAKGCVGMFAIQFLPREQLIAGPLIRLFSGSRLMFSFEDILIRFSSRCAAVLLQPQMEFAVPVWFAWLSHGIQHGFY